MAMRRRCVLVLISVLAFGVPAWAQDGADPAKPAAVPAAAAAAQGQVAPEDDTDLDIDPLQPDFTLIALPTTLRMPRMKSAFRVTHRFTRSLGQGDFGSLAEDFFGIDSGAAIGLEYRFGLMRGTDVGVRRTNDRTVEFHWRNYFCCETLAGSCCLRTNVILQFKHDLRILRDRHDRAIIAKCCFRGRRVTR